MRRAVVLAHVLAAALTCAWPFAARADRARGLAAFDAGDYATALVELKPAAEGGDTEASYTLGLMYEQGRGVATDDAEAVRWYRRAAEGGHANAQYVLGVHEQIGLGTAMNFVDAYKWLLLAQRGGVAAAQEFVASFARRMSQEEIAQATAMADAACRESSPACRPPAPIRSTPPAAPSPPVVAHVDAQPIEGKFVIMQRSTPMLDAPGSGHRVASLSQWDRLIASARTNDGWIRGKAKGKEGWVSGASVGEETMVEKIEWSKVDPNDVRQLELFLKHFPNGDHRKIAEVKLAAARRATAQREGPAEVPEAKQKAPGTATIAGSPPPAGQGPAPPQDVAPAAPKDEPTMGDFVDQDINSRAPVQRDGSVPLAHDEEANPPGVNSRVCRIYSATRTVLGRPQAVQGLACRMPDGRWQLVTESPSP